MIGDPLKAKQYQASTMTTTERTTNGRRGGETIDQLADFLMLAQRSCFLDLSKDLNAGRISYAQLFLLGSLDQTESLTMSEIARRMGHSTAAATGLVDRLQKLGYVDRMHAEEDRRKIMVMITDKGRRMVRRMRETLASSLARLLAGLDAEDRPTLPQRVRRATSAFAD